MLHNIKLIVSTRVQTSVPPAAQIRSCNPDTYIMYAGIGQIHT